MNFEQALRAELITVSNLSNKVFPLFAPEGTNTPFLVYQKTLVDIIKTMDGTSTTRDGRYELDLVCATYDQLQTLIQAVKSKLISFEGRTIGTSGPYVQSLTIENMIELFEEEVEFYRINFEIRVYFVEVL